MSNVYNERTVVNLCINVDLNIPNWAPDDSAENSRKIHITLAWMCEIGWLRWTDGLMTVSTIWTPLYLALLTGQMSSPTASQPPHAIGDDNTHVWSLPKLHIPFGNQERGRVCQQTGSITTNRIQIRGTFLKSCANFLTVCQIRSNKSYNVIH